MVRGRSRGSRGGPSTSRNAPGDTSTNRSQTPIPRAVAQQADKSARPSNPQATSPARSANPPSSGQVSLPTRQTNTGTAPVNATQGDEHVRFGARMVVFLLMLREREKKEKDDMPGVRFLVTDINEDSREIRFKYGHVWASPYKVSLEDLKKWRCPVRYRKFGNVKGGTWFLSFSQLTDTIVEFCRQKMAARSSGADPNSFRMTFRLFRIPEKDRRANQLEFAMNCGWIHGDAREDGVPHPLDWILTRDSPAWNYPLHVYGV